MAFSFQINDDIEFEHNKTLLNKATKYEPELSKHLISTFAVGKLKDNRSKLGGTEVVEDKKRNLNTPLKRGESMILDFQTHRVGKFSIHIESVGSPMDAPLTIRIKFAEMPIELTQESSDYDGWLSKSWIQEETIHLDELPIDLKLPRRYSFRYVELKVIDTSPKWQAVLSNPKVITETSIKSDYTESLVSEDSEIQSIYDVGLTTLRECMQNVFEDGPKRDRRLWIGDLRLQAKADYATFRDTTLVKRCLYLFGAMPAKNGRVAANVFVKPETTPDDTFLFDYGLFFISALDDLMNFEFDQEILDDLYPVAQKQIDLALTYVDKNGALRLDEDYPVFIDWSNDFDKNTAGQAILIYALKQFIHLTQLSGKSMSHYEETLSQLITYSKATLFDDNIGLFSSGNNHEFNIASQTWMVLAGVFEPDINKKIMKTAEAKLFPVTGIATPYMYHHIVEALFESGLRQDAVKLMKNYWGKMISLGADTYWEAFDPDNPDYSPYGSTLLNSYCHAWSCTPVYLINRYLKE